MRGAVFVHLGFCVSSFWSACPLAWRRVCVLRVCMTSFWPACPHAWCRVRAFRLQRFCDIILVYLTLCMTPQWFANSQTWPCDDIFNVVQVTALVRLTLWMTPYILCRSSRLSSCMALFWYFQPFRCAGTRA